MNNDQSHELTLKKIKEIYKKTEFISSINDINSIANEMTSLFGGNKEEKSEKLFNFLESEHLNKEFNALNLMMILYRASDSSDLNHIYDSIDIFIQKYSASVEFINKLIRLETDEDFINHYKNHWLTHN